MQWHTVFVDDLDERVGQHRRPRRRGHLHGRRSDNGVRKVTYRDRDGNEIGFGGAPAE